MIDVSDDVNNQYVIVIRKHKTDCATGFSLSDFIEEILMDFALIATDLVWSNESDIKADGLNGSTGQLSGTGKQAMKILYIGSTCLKMMIFMGSQAGQIANLSTGL